jgi:hypothetical protein
MSTLVIAQTNNAGVQMSASVTNADTTDIVVTFVSSIDDAAGSIDKSFPATSVAPGSFQLTDEDLTTLFGVDNLNLMKAGDLSPALSMSAQQFDTAGAEVEEAQTGIVDVEGEATVLNKMYYLQFALPLAPVEVSVSPGDSKLTIVATVFSKNAVDNKIKVTVHKTSALGLGVITNSEVTGTAGNVSNGVRTFTFDVVGLDNGSQYEIFAKFANTGANDALQYGPKNTTAFQGEPNQNPGPLSNVTVATALNGDVFDSINAATVNAQWVKTETDGDGNQPTSYKMYVAKSGDNSKSLEVAQSGANSVATGDIVTLAPASIPRSWFVAETEITINVAIKQIYADGSSTLGNVISGGSVFLMIMPSFDGGLTPTTNNVTGVQTVNAFVLTPGAGEHTLSSTFNGADSTSGLNGSQVVKTYDEINAAEPNKTVEFTYSVVDANDGVTTYAVTSSIELYAFKDPIGPNAPTIAITSFGADPVISFTKADSSNNNGWTIASYKVVVEYVGPAGNDVASYGNPYSATFTYAEMPVSLTAISNTEFPYIAGDYKVTVTSVFSYVIPTQYNNLAVLPEQMSAESASARWWTRATITDITVTGTTMTITGNNGGATYTTVGEDAITSIGFVAGDASIENDYSMSKKTQAMSVGSNGLATDRTAANLFDFTVELIHNTDLIDLSGDYLDGLGFVDADNAPSALSIAVFNTGDIA